MERFAIKIDKSLKSNLYKICRLCGIDNPDKVKILDKHDITLDDGEVELWKKIFDCIGIQVKKDDKMPQSICTLCIDKISDFYEFREMCYATNLQTRQLLGLKAPPKPKLEPKIEDAVVDLKLPIPVLAAAIVKTAPGRKRKKEPLPGAIPVIPLKHIKKDEAGPSTKLVKPTLAFLKKQKLQKLEIDKQIKNEKEEKIQPVKKIPTKKFKDKCVVCSQGFPNSCLLEKHLLDKHIPEIFRYHCVHCNETLKKNLEIKDHNLWHRLSKTPFACGRCSKVINSINQLTKHTRECGIPLAKSDILPDIQCKKCNQIFLTNFLFNIHSCAITKKCPGCSKVCRTKDDTVKHIPLCSMTTRKVPPHLVAVTEVKSEPVGEVAETQLPRDNVPTMDANQFVVIPPNVNIINSPTTKGKKNNRITKKDLKRYDELLKSTMTTFVSIKQEPIQDDPASPPPSDDHHGNDDYFSDNHEESSAPIKQEIIDEGYRDLDNNIEVNIKKEIVLTSTPAEQLKTVPVLKLKIKKEHGQLVPSVIDGNDRKKDKKKKKKKSEKHIDRTESPANKPQNNECVNMPMPGIIHIKQERIDEAYNDCNDYSVDDHNMSTGDENVHSDNMPTNCPLQISTVSSGVDFSSEQLPLITNVSSVPISPPREEQESDGNTILQETAIHETDLPKISLIASGVDIHKKVQKKKQQTKSYSSTKLPLIASVSSGIDFEAFSNQNPKEIDVNTVIIKQEIVDTEYDHNTVDDSICSGDSTHISDILDQSNVNQMEQSEVEDELEEAKMESSKHEDEQEFIKNIDFNNLIIKQEIEVAEEAFGDEIPSSDSEDYMDEDEETGSHDMSEVDDTQIEKDSGVLTNPSSVDEHRDSVENNEHVVTDVSFKLSQPYSLDALNYTTEKDDSHHTENITIKTDNVVDIVLENIIAPLDAVGIPSLARLCQLQLIAQCNYLNDQEMTENVKHDIIPNEVLKSTEHGEIGSLTSFQQHNHLDDQEMTEHVNQSKIVQNETLNKTKITELVNDHSKHDLERIGPMSSWQQNSNIDDQEMKEPENQIGDALINTDIELMKNDYMCDSASVGTSSISHTDNDQEMIDTENQITTNQGDALVSFGIVEQVKTDDQEMKETKNQFGDALINTDIELMKNDYMCDSASVGTSSILHNDKDQEMIGTDNQITTNQGDALGTFGIVEQVKKDEQVNSAIVSSLASWYQTDNQQPTTDDNQGMLIDDRPKNSDIAEFATRDQKNDSVNVGHLISSSDLCDFTSDLKIDKTMSTSIFSCNNLQIASTVTDNSLFAENNYKSNNLTAAMEKHLPCNDTKSNEEREGQHISPSAFSSVPSTSSAVINVNTHAINTTDDFLKTVLTEEVENLLKEDENTTYNFCTSSSANIVPSTPSISFFNNFEDINEIAENHNNANIEKELLDEISNSSNMFDNILASEPVNETNNENLPINDTDVT